MSAPRVDEAEALAGVLRVEMSKVYIPDRHGPYPCCAPKVGTHFCRRCGRNLNKSAHRQRKAVPRADRWRPGGHAAPPDGARGSGT